MSGLYLAGFYAQGSDRLWASVLMLVVVLLGVGLAYCWYGWRLRQVQPEHAGRLSDTAQPQEGKFIGTPATRHAGKPPSAQSLGRRHRETAGRLDS
jgi:hypothetical protein